MVAVPSISSSSEWNQLEPVIKTNIAFLISNENFVPKQTLTTIHINQVQLDRCSNAIGRPLLDACAHNRILKLGRNDHLEHARQAVIERRTAAARRRRRPIALFQQHKLVQRIVPLHQENARGQRAAQVLVAVVRIPRNATLCTALGVGHLGGERKLARHQSFGNLVHVQRKAMRLLRVQRQQIVAIQLGTLAGQTHQHVFNDVQPGGASRMYLVDGRIVQFVHVQLEDAFFGADEQMLVARLRVDPRGGAVDAQRTTVEDLGEAGAHVDLGRGRQTVGDGSRGCVATAVRAFRRHWWCVVEEIGLGLLVCGETNYMYVIISI